METMKSNNGLPKSNNIECNKIIYTKCKINDKQTWFITNICLFKHLISILALLVMVTSYVLVMDVLLFLI